MTELIVELWPLIFFIPIWVWMINDIRQMNRQISVWKELSEMKRRQSFDKRRSK